MTPHTWSLQCSIPLTLTSACEDNGQRVRQLCTKLSHLEFSCLRVWWEWEGLDTRLIAASVMESLLRLFVLSPQKTFTPIVPTRRVKKEAPVDGLPAPVEKMEKQLGDRRRKSVDRKRGMGRGRGRGKDIITSASVFSMGPAERTMERRKGQMWIWVLIILLRVVHSLLPRPSRE